jgi:hypothetical protein
LKLAHKSGTVSRVVKILSQKAIQSFESGTVGTLFMHLKLLKVYLTYENQFISFCSWGQFISPRHDMASPIDDIEIY